VTPLWTEKDGGVVTLSFPPFRRHFSPRKQEGPPSLERGVNPAFHPDHFLDVPPSGRNSEGSDADVIMKAAHVVGLMKVALTPMKPMMASPFIRSQYCLSSVEAPTPHCCVLLSRLPVVKHATLDASLVQRGAWRQPGREITTAAGVSAVCIVDPLRCGIHRNSGLISLINCTSNKFQFPCWKSTGFAVDSSTISGLK
jgi:hypothetical protein